MIYALPGMGADNTMYCGPWRGLPDSRFLDWPAYAGETTIEAIASRVVDEAGIPDGAVLIGTSLGGMVACEIARQRRLQSLVLIGSATAPEEISGVLAALHPLVSVAPVRFLQAAAGKLPSDLMQMFSRSEPEFIRAMCRAVFHWRGLAPSCIDPLRVHGRNDRVIPLPAEADLVLDGGHLIVITHAEACANFVSANLALQERTGERPM